MGVGVEGGRGVGVSNKLEGDCGDFVSDEFYSFKMAETDLFKTVPLNGVGSERGVGFGLFPNSPKKLRRRSSVFY